MGKGEEERGQKAKLCRWSSRFAILAFGPRCGCSSRQRGRQNSAATSPTAFCGYACLVACIGNGYNPNPGQQCGVPALTRSAQAPEPERTSALKHYASPQARHPI
jgi:hypothetical protein